MRTTDSELVSALVSATAAAVVLVQALARRALQVAMGDRYGPGAQNLRHRWRLRKPSSPRSSLSPLSPSTLVVLGLAAVLWASVSKAHAQPAQAQAHEVQAASIPPAMMEALARANASVVGVRVAAVEDAPSAETLGARRHGSGVVISPDGLILTIGYLLMEAEQIEVVTQDNRAWPARAVAYDLATGFGLVRPLIPLRDTAFAPLGNSQSLQAGEALMAVTGPQAPGDGGNDAEISMTRLVGQRSFTGTWEYHIDSALFTSPPVVTGGGNHSGAPLFNHRGELVGIGSLLVGDASGPGAAPGADSPPARRLPGNMFVPVDLLRPILGELQKTGSSPQSHRPWLGVTSNAKDGKVHILRVSKNSPAESAGLAAGDVVLAVDGVQVGTLEGFYKKLWDRSAPDAEIRLTVQQGDEPARTVSLQAEDRLLMLRKPATI